MLPLTLTFGLWNLVVALETLSGFEGGSVPVADSGFWGFILLDDFG